MKLHATRFFCLGIFLCGTMLGQQQMESSPAPAAPKPEAQPAKADSQVWSPLDGFNQALPKWIRFSGQVRMRLEGYEGGGFNPANEDAYLLTRLWLNLKVQPSPWLKFYFQSQDSHAPWKHSLPAGPPFRDTMDLRQGYVELGDVEKPSVGFRFGRQELEFGEGRLVGALPWANTARTFDGFRGSFVGNGFRLDAFAATVVKIEQDNFDQTTPGNNFYGLYSSFKKLVPKATFEPYFLWRRQSGLRTELATPGTMNFGTYGLRWVGKLPANFDYNTDIAGQHGSLGSESIGAWASHVQMGYSVPKARFTPRIFAEYNHATGDENPTDNKRGTFDQLYPTGHDKYGLTDQVGWQNIHHLRTGVEFKFNKKWMATGRYNGYWLANAHDALYTAGSAVIARVPAGTAGRFVGQGFDLVSAYTFNSRLSVSGGFGKIYAGTFLKNATPGGAYNFPYLMTVYNF
jgi:hypothetical protein